MEIRTTIPVYVAYSYILIPMRIGMYVYVLRILVYQTNTHTNSHTAHDSADALLGSLARAPVVTADRQCWQHSPVIIPLPL